MLNSQKNNLSLVGKKPPDSLPDIMKKSKSLHTLLLEFLDVILPCVIVGPCVIAYWRGTWELLDIWIFPHSKPLSALTCFLIGGLGHFIFTFTQTYFKSHIHPDKRRLTYYLFSRLYTAIFGIVCVNMWRGIWLFYDCLINTDSLITVSVVSLMTLLLLTITRTLRNLVAAPYTVMMDHKSDYFDVVTRFNVPGFYQPGLYALDTLFTIFCIGPIVAIAWRGLWAIIDLTFYTDSRVISAWGSLFIGYSIVGTTFIIQPLVHCMCKNVKGLSKLIICDIFYLTCFVGSLNTWRGIWILLDVYVYPDNPMLSCWLTHAIPFLILTSLKCSNSILVRGVFIDAEETGGDCVEMPINYVKQHFVRERSKKYSGVHSDTLNQRVTLIDKTIKPEPKISSDIDAAQVV